MEKPSRGFYQPIAPWIQDLRKNPWDCPACGWIDAISFISNWDWERIGLALILIGYSIYGTFEVKRETEPRKSPTHRHFLDFDYTN